MSPTSWLITRLEPFVTRLRTVLGTLSIRVHDAEWQLLPLKPAIASKLQGPAVLSDRPNHIVRYASRDFCIDVQCDLHV